MKRGRTNWTIVAVLLGAATSVAVLIHLTFDLAARVHTTQQQALEQQP